MSIMTLQERVNSLAKELESAQERVNSLAKEFESAQKDIVQYRDKRQRTQLTDAEILNKGLCIAYEAWGCETRKCCGLSTDLKPDAEHDYSKVIPEHFCNKHRATYERFANANNGKGAFIFSPHSHQISVKQAKKADVFLETDRITAKREIRIGSWLGCHGFVGQPPLHSYIGKPAISTGEWRVLPPEQGEGLLEKRLGSFNKGQPSGTPTGFMNEKNWTNEVRKATTSTPIRTKWIDQSREKFYTKWDTETFSFQIWKTRKRGDRSVWQCNECVPEKTDVFTQRD